MADVIDIPEVVVESPGGPSGGGADSGGPDLRPLVVKRKGAPSPGQEIATLVVRGVGEFEDWETIWVQDNWLQFFAEFKFTCAEREPYPKNFEQLLQFKPGDECAIYLGGLLVITGIILIRQIAYDANNHQVMLQGVSISWYAQKASIVDKDGNYDGMSYTQIVEKVLAPTGVKPKYVGTIDGTKFERMQNEPGEPIGQFLQRIGQDRKVIVAGDAEGHMVFITDHTAKVVGGLIEGQNIKKCQCVITDMELRSFYITRAQTAANNQQHGRKASEQEATAGGSARRYNPLVTMIEHPVWTGAEVAKRNDMEATWREGTKIEATITVQGWFDPNGDLWQAGLDVYVKSPMAILDMVMKIQSVTFTQDRASGSLTTLICVPPWRFFDRGLFPPDGLRKPSDSKPNTDAAQTPPPA